MFTEPLQEPVCETGLLAGETVNKEVPGAGAAAGSIDAREARAPAVSAHVGGWRVDGETHVSALARASGRDGSPELPDLLRKLWPTLLVTHPAELARALDRVPYQRMVSDSSLRTLRHALRVAGPGHVGAQFPFADLDAIGSPPDLRLELIVVALRLDALRASGQTDAAFELGRSTAARLEGLPDEQADERSDTAASFYASFGATLLIRGDLPSASEAFGAGMAAAARADVAHAALACSGGLALCHALRGWLDEASRCLTTVSSLSTDARLADTHAAVPARIAAALCALERADTETAIADVGALRRLGAPREYLPFLIHIEGLSRLVTRDVDGGLAAVNLTSAMMRQDWSPTAFGSALIDTARAELLAAAGHHDSALAAADTIDLPGEHVVCAPTGRGYAHLLAGRPQDALDAVTPCCVVDGAHPPRTQVSALVIAAAARQQLGHHTGATMAFRQALAVADLTGIRRPILGLPRAIVAELIARTRAGGADSASLRMCEELSVGTTQPGSRLSPRERLILSYLDSDLPIYAIADVLVVSPNTVKTQLRSLYGKLGVHSREEAVRSAKAEGLL